MDLLIASEGVHFSKSFEIQAGSFRIDRLGKVNLFELVCSLSDFINVIIRTVTGKGWNGSLKTVLLKKIRRLKDIYIHMIATKKIISNTY